MASEGTVKPLIVVHPAAASKTTKEMLRRAGYIVVVAENPEHFTALQVMPLVAGAGDAAVILRAAMEAIHEASSSSVQREFGTAVARRMARAEPSDD